MKTINNTELVEPIKLYNSQLKDAFHDNAVEYFDNLLKQSEIDVNKNRELSKQYYDKVNKINNLSKSLSGKKGLKGFLIFLIVFLFIAMIVFVILCFNGALSNLRWLWFILAFASLGGAIVLIVHVSSKLNKILKNLNEQIQILNGEAELLKSQAISVISPLFSLFDYNIPATLITKTMPLIQMDEIFDPSKYQYIHEKYGFNENKDKDRSTVYVQSGSILGNPFIIMKDYVTYLYKKTYTGSLTIFWTTREYDGKTWRTVNHSQVLHASYQEDAPAYYYDTYLVYGCDAAPKLSFSRKPTVHKDWDEKDIAKKARSFDKKLDRLVEEGIKNNTGFTKLQNAQFEMCFNALDRDNELEFRLLFTPLAQNNLMQLLTSKEPYGDDFSFIKNKCLNYIKSDHSQGDNLYETDPQQYFHFDIDVMKKNFINSLDNYLKMFYFDLAPLISIPLYQQTKTKEYIYKDIYYANVTSFEVESTANGYDPELFRPGETSTGIILKEEFLYKKGNSDIVNIHSYSYKGINRTIYIPVSGGDGKIHNVPVDYIEYEPRDAVTPLQIQRLDTTRTDFINKTATSGFTSYFTGNRNNAIIFRKRFFSSILQNDASIYDDQILTNLFSKGEK